MKLIIGLGNPGNEYKHTRHNIGFETIDKLCFDFNISVRSNKNIRRVHFGTGRIGNIPVVLAKPQTYMNLSGIAVRALLDFYNLPPSEMLIVCDDVNLPTGDIRIRKTGGAGGHNGMKSIIEHIKTQDFPRVRIGIDPKPENWVLADYVLSRFKKEEWELMIDGVTKAGEAVEMWLKDGADTAMNRFNKKVVDTFVKGE